MRAGPPPPPPRAHACTPPTPPHPTPPHLTFRQGVENVYTQHTPPLVGLLEKLARGKLPELEYPRVERSRSPQPPQAMVRHGFWNGQCGGRNATPCAPCPPSLQPPRLVVVFVIGGTTYEEARAVAELNAAADKREGWAGGMRFVLGGTSVHNSSSFLAELGEVLANERYNAAGGGGGGM